MVTPSPCLHFHRHSELLWDPTLINDLGLCQRLDGAGLRTHQTPLHLHHMIRYNQKSISKVVKQSLWAGTLRGFMGQDKLLKHGDVHFVEFAMPDVLHQIQPLRIGHSYLSFQAHEGELFV
ncbi:hypothetical protein SCLCIDRAFT_1214199 [Scleroderma citrinum Foug A]|uniref:Uncharacterized protein n=1 Tax=Scleroderma citrinum Foug A TaxID=1036808 RepID=A0A0C3AEE2_9AGAM|nr:hypothetical protein SCLCIDRAFT_1214199 [Scleroderma citrinum Foug A]